MSHQGTLSTYSKLKNITNKALKELGFADIKLSNGYYKFSGFATAPSGQIIYVSSGDTRDVELAKRLGTYMGLMARTATSYKDYSGGRNNFAKDHCEYDQYVDDIEVIKKLLSTLI